MSLKILEVFYSLLEVQGRSRENSSTLIFFLKILPLKDDELVTSEM